MSAPILENKVYPLNKLNPDISKNHNKTGKKLWHPHIYLGNTVSLIQKGESVWNIALKQKWAVEIVNYLLISCTTFLGPLNIFLSLSH